MAQKILEQGRELRPRASQSAAERCIDPCADRFVVAQNVVAEIPDHAGHAGDDGSGESHWQVVIEAPGLADKSRLARHRAVHDALGPEIIGRIHALAISFK